MRDEYYECFIEAFGEATSSIIVPPVNIEKWNGILPDILMSYWKCEGWATYGNGLFSLVDPDEYEDVLDMWLADTLFEESDSYHVIARNAFGKLYAFGERSGKNLTISCQSGQIISLKKERVNKTPEELSLDIKAFISASEPEDFDLEDNSGNLIFDRAVKVLGPLGHDEVFGFEPALVLGGIADVKNVKKLNCQIHLSILRELSLPSIFEF